MVCCFLIPLRWRPKGVSHQAQQIWDNNRSFYLPKQKLPVQIRDIDSIHINNSDIRKPRQCLRKTWSKPDTKELNHLLIMLIYRQDEPSTHNSLPDWINGGAIFTFFSAPASYTTNRWLKLRPTITDNNHRILPNLWEVHNRDLRLLWLGFYRKFVEMVKSLMTAQTPDVRKGNFARETSEYGSIVETSYR